ncbi:MAG: hypothetical protein PVH62_05495 [Anaerolineae bacterium]
MAVLTRAQETTRAELNRLEQSTLARVFREELWEDDGCATLTTARSGACGMVSVSELLFKTFKAGRGRLIKCFLDEEQVAEAAITLVVLLAAWPLMRTNRRPLR